MLKVWYSFLLCWLSLQLEANPGLKVRITQKGLDYGRRIAMELLKQAVLKETFPSWSGQESFLVIKANYVISRLRINALDFPETSASFIPGTGISLSIAHASATISADWRMNAWLLKDEGGITVSISGAFIAVIFKVSRDSTGRFSILLHNCQLSINGIKVKLNGGSSWIYSFLSGYLEKPIHTKLNKNLCLNIKHKIKMMDEQLRRHKDFSELPNSVPSAAEADGYITTCSQFKCRQMPPTDHWLCRSVCCFAKFNHPVHLFRESNSQYQSQFDNNQTEVDYLITSEEVTKENSESSINYPNIKTQQNFIASA